MNNNNRFFNNPFINSVPQNPLPNQTNYQYSPLQVQQQLQQLGQMNQQPIVNNKPISPGIIKVNGLEGAKAFQIGFNEVAFLLNESENELYIKTTDSSGFPTIKEFTIQEKTPDNKPNEVTNFVTKEEFENFRKEILNRYEQQQ